MSDKLTNFWRGKTVLVTGASSGLGKAIVEALAPYEIKFCLLSRRVEKMQEIAAALQNYNSVYWIRSCDVRKREEVYSAVQDFCHEHGGIDVAWVNSGISRNTSFYKWNWETAENLIATNLHGAIYTTMACLEAMVPQKSGTIVGICSAASMRGLAGTGVYCLTKIGLAYFLESMAAELHNIHFTIIHPGFVDTPINQGLRNRIWLMTPEKAAQLMIKGVARRKNVMIYPFRMKVLYHLARAVPASWYYGFSRRFLSRRRGSEQ